MTTARIPPVITIRGMQASRTIARRHPFIKAIIKPPKNVATSCINFPTCQIPIVYSTPTEECIYDIKVEERKMKKNVTFSPMAS